MERRTKPVFDEQAPTNMSFKFLSDLVANESDLDIRTYTLKIKEQLTKLEN
jgi:hypothetical protein